MPPKPQSNKKPLQTNNKNNNKTERNNPPDQKPHGKIEKRANGSFQMKTLKGEIFEIEQLVMQPQGGANITENGSLIIGLVVRLRTKTEGK